MKSDERMVPTKSDIREELDMLRDIGLELDGYPERIARLRSAMEGLSRVMQNSPDKNASSGDKLSKQMAELDRLERELPEEVLRYEDAVHELKMMLALLPTPQRAVMELRYIRGWKWREVAKHLHYSYRHCTKLHRKAIEKMPHNAPIFRDNI